MFRRGVWPLLVCLVLLAAPAAQAAAPYWTHSDPAPEVEVYEHGSIDFRAVCEDEDGDLDVLFWWRDHHPEGSATGTNRTIDAFQTIFFPDLGTRQVQALCRDEAGAEVAMVWRVTVRSSGEPLDVQETDLADHQEGDGRTGTAGGNDGGRDWLETGALLAAIFGPLIAIVGLVVGRRKKKR